MFHLAWLYWIISFLMEFLIAEHDWKFLLNWIFNNRKCSLDIVEVYLQKYMQNPACQISKMEFFTKIVMVIGYKQLNIFAKDSTLDVWQGSEYAWFNHKLYFEIFSFYLHCIPCIFLCANDKLVITQKPCAILKIFHTHFLYLAVISQDANYKINSPKIFSILHSAPCDNSVLIY